MMGVIIKKDNNHIFFIKGSPEKVKEYCLNLDSEYDN